MKTSTAKENLAKTRNNLPEKTRSAVVQLLNERLADTFDLYSQIKQAHWNVQGPNFYQLHELFDDLAEEILPFVDTIAERVTALGGVAQGTARMAGQASTLPEYKTGAADGREHLEALIERYGIYTTNIRQAIDAADEHDDKDTADLFTEISREADKQLWFLEAHTR